MAWILADRAQRRPVLANVGDDGLAGFDNHTAAPIGLHSGDRNRELVSAGRNLNAVSAIAPVAVLNVASGPQLTVTNALANTAASGSVTTLRIVACPACDSARLPAATMSIAATSQSASRFMAAADRSTAAPRADEAKRGKM